MSAAAKSQELVTPQAQLELAAQVILGQAEMPEAPDPEAMSLAIMRRILEAESFEQAFTQQNLTPWRELLGRWVKVLNVHFNRSTIEQTGGSGLYAVVDLLDNETGESLTVTCGGKNVLAQLIVGLKNGWLGGPGSNTVRMIENQTANGYKVLWLEAPPD